jgi:hypothetical protein
VVNCALCNANFGFNHADGELMKMILPNNVAKGTKQSHASGAIRAMLPYRASNSKSRADKLNPSRGLGKTEVPTKFRPAKISRAPFCCQKLFIFRGTIPS